MLLAMGWNLKRLKSPKLRDLQSLKKILFNRGWLRPSHKVLLSQGRKKVLPSNSEKPRLSPLASSDEAQRLANVRAAEKENEARKKLKRIDK
jgi:hypothetical protein